MQKTPISGKIEPAHYEIEYKSECVDGNMITIPKTTWVNERYYILYELVLSNDETYTMWQRVPESIYREWENQR